MDYPQSFISESLPINRESAEPGDGLSRDSLAERAADAIRNSVLTGEYKLGQRLREAGFAKRFDVSHHVIREAFHILQGEGIVVTDPYRGRAVFRLSESESRELVLVRTSLESLAAHLAAEKLTKNGEEEISREALRIKSTMPGTYTEWVRLELAFHRSVWRAAQNRWLFKQLNQLAVPMYTLNTITFFSNDVDSHEILRIAPEWEASKNARGHQRVAEAILSRNVQLARDTMIIHVMGAPHLEELRRQMFQL